MAWKKKIVAGVFAYSDGITLIILTISILPLTSLAIRTITGTAQNGIFFQIELKGLTGIGVVIWTNSLQQTIYGYRKSQNDYGQNTIKKAIISLLICNLLFGNFLVRAEVLGKIAAVVEDDVILEQELDREVSAIAQRIQASKTQMPPEYILRKQVLEKMIIDKLQRQLAEKAGITVTEEMLNNSAADIAQRNNMTLQQFRAELERQGMSYKSFLDNMRNEIIINQLRSREIGGRIKVTDREVDHYMETQEKIGNEAVQYHLGHILIAVKEAASATDIQKAQSKADDLVKKLRAGQDFTQTAMSDSDDDNALKGGDLGWRTTQ